ncbi:fer-1-like protein 5 [Cyanocitta cristata]
MAGAPPPSHPSPPPLSAPARGALPPPPQRACAGRAPASPSARKRGARSRLPLSASAPGALPPPPQRACAGRAPASPSARVRRARSRGTAECPRGKRPAGSGECPRCEGTLEAHPAPRTPVGAPAGSRSVPRGDTGTLPGGRAARAAGRRWHAGAREPNRRAARQRADGTRGSHTGGSPVVRNLRQRSVAMLRCHVVAVHIPGASGFGPGVLLSVCFRGTSRRTQVVPEERSLTWNEELVWPLDTCPLSATDTLSLRLRRWDRPVPQGDLGATTVSLDELVANPSLPMALRDIPLLDHRERRTGCTVTFRCSYDPHGAAGDLGVTTHGQVALEPPRCSGMGPADRKEDFQVRVRVIKGSQLRGKDIKPVVKVLIGKQNFRTRSRTGNNPYFNEVFCQNFRQTPEQLVAQPIRVQVLRSSNICTKSVIGVFELDVGTVYSAPGRSLSGKWLSLRHPRHRDGRSQGFLQLSLAVRRAGERAQEQEMPAGDEDVAANLLRPPAGGTALLLRVFRAEDLPWAEPPRPCLGGTKGSLKVSVRAGFGGRTLCTRGVPPDASPEWNEVFFFPLQLPPICDEIQLEILRGSCRSKVLGRATLSLSQLYRDRDELEEGTPSFLPSFGPSFLPFYGPRPDAPRDAGLVYRGRVLLEICTHLGNAPGRQRDTVTPLDVERAQRSRLPRCQLGLCGVFYAATMVPGGPEPLRLELGIGSAAAATEQGLPAFDGNLYHHLPWLGDKPVAAVTSLWEDAGHRWDSLNLLRALCQRLERNLAQLRRCRGDAARAVGARLLRELARDCA